MDRYLFLALVVCFLAGFFLPLLPALAISAAAGAISGLISRRVRLAAVRAAERTV